MHGRLSQPSSLVEALRPLVNALSRLLSVACLDEWRSNEGFYCTSLYLADDILRRVQQLRTLTDFRCILLAHLIERLFRSSRSQWNITTAAQNIRLEVSTWKQRWLARSDTTLYVKDSDQIGGTQHRFIHVLSTHYGIKECCSDDNTGHVTTGIGQFSQHHQIAHHFSQDP